MKVVYLSLTGQTRRFVQKLELPTVEITPQNVFQTMNELYIIVVLLMIWKYLNIFKILLKQMITKLYQKE